MIKIDTHTSLEISETIIKRIKSHPLLNKISADLLPTLKAEIYSILRDE